MTQRTDDNSVNNEGGIIESHGSLDGSVSGNFGESGGSLTVLLPSQVGQSIQVHEVSKVCNEELLCGLWRLALSTCISVC